DLVVAHREGTRGRRRVTRIHKRFRREEIQGHAPRAQVADRTAAERLTAPGTERGGGVHGFRARPRAAPAIPRPDPRGYRSFARSGVSASIRAGAHIPSAKPTSISTAGTPPPRFCAWFARARLERKFLKEPMRNERKRPRSGAAWAMSPRARIRARNPCTAS